MKMSDVTIITGTYNNPQFLGVYLKTLSAYTQKGFSLIIIENGDDPQSKKLLSTYKTDIFKDRMTILRGNSNWSFARFNNEGTHYAKTKLVLFANDDVVFSPFWLQSMIDLVKPDVGAVGKRLLDFEGKCVWHCDMTRNVEETPATCLLVRRELALFDEGFTGYYMEDIALCRKIRGLGFLIAVEYDHPVRHFGQATFEKKDNQAELISQNDVYYRSLFNGT